MRVCIHQPNYLPYAGLFDKIMNTDLFVIFDRAKFSKGKENFHARNKIRIENGWRYLTIPIPKKYDDSALNRVKFTDNRFKKKHRSIIHQHYYKALYYKDYGEDFEKLYENKTAYLNEFNLEIIKFLMSAFGIRTKIILSSELDIDFSLQGTDIVIEILKAVGAKSYLSGSGAKNYLEEEKIKEAGIEVEYQNFIPKPYFQVYPGFEPFMSAIDLLFNCGKTGLGMVK